MSVFGNWGVRQGLLMANPFAGMKFILKKHPHKKEPFNKDDLRTILNLETYLNWTIRFEHRFRDSRATNQMPYFWIFLWGYFQDFARTKCARHDAQILERERKSGLCMLKKVKKQK